MSKVTDFEILREISDENTSDGIALFLNIVSTDMRGGNGYVTFGTPPQAIEWALKDTHIFIMYAVKKQDFIRVKNKLTKA